ncbi:unnamed protein product, partial [Effrenium voratum]
MSGRRAGRKAETLAGAGAELIFVAEHAEDPRLDVYRQKGEEVWAELKQQARRVAGAAGSAPCACDVHYSWACLERLQQAQELGKDVLVGSVLLPSSASQEEVQLSERCTSLLFQAKGNLIDAGLAIKGARKNFCRFAVAFPVSKKLSQMKPPYLVIDDVGSSHSLGQILRSAYHFGVDSVVLTERAWAFLDARAFRVSVGWGYHMDFHLASSLPEVVAQLAQGGVDLFMASDDDASENVETAKGPWALLVGAREAASGPELPEVSAVKVPCRLQGTMDIAHSAAICIYELAGFVVPALRETCDAERTMAHPARAVWLVEGSALKAEDLDRVRYQSCLAAFLLPNMYGSDPEREDVGNIMRALTMKRHTSYIRLVCMILKAHSVEGLLSVRVPPQDIVCFDNVIQGILGKSAEVHGYLTLASSMLKTSKKMSNAEITKKGYIWAEDYATSLGMTLFEVELPSSYKSVPFCEVATDICERSGSWAFLIGLAEEALYPSDITEYVLFPNKYYRVGLQQDRDVKGIVMARQREDINMALPGRAIRWSPEAWATGSTQTQANPRLSTLKAAKDTEGWVRDHFTEESDKQAYLQEKLAVAAKRRAALGLVHRGKLSRVQVEAYLDEMEDDYFDTRDELEDVMEDSTSEVMQDPFERALLERRMEAKRQILDEKEAMDAEAADDILYGENESIRVGLASINKAEEAQYRQRMPDPIVQREDEMLWGAPVAPLEKIWANAKEPPDELLVRGDHIVLLSLESDLPEDTEQEDTLATGKRKPLRPGRMLPLKTFIRSMRSQKKRRPLVVVSKRVPVDWARVMHEPLVFLVLGVPFSPTSLERAGFLQAKSIVIYQRDVQKCSDAPLVDSKAVFAQRLVEALVAEAGKVSTPVIMHIHLEDNTELMTETAEPKKAKGLLEMLESKTREDDDDDGGQSKYVEADEMQQIVLQHRFASGVL